MATGKSSNSSRRRDIRRSVPKPQADWKASLKLPYIRWTLLYIFGTTLIGSLLLNSADHRPHHVVGQVTHQAIVPRVQFQAIDEYQTRDQKRNAQSREPAVYKINTPYLMQVQHGLEQLLLIGEEYDDISQIPLTTRSDLFIDRWTLSQLKKFTRDEKDRKQWAQKISHFIDGIEGQAMLSPAQLQTETARNTQSPLIKIIHPHLGELVRASTNIYSTANVKRFRKNVTKLATTLFPAAVRKAVIAVVMNKIQPVYVLDQALTTARRQAAYNRVEPVKNTFTTDIVMIPSQTKLTSQDIKLLQMEEQAYRHWLEQTPVISMMPALRASHVRMLGRGGIMLVICIALWSYLLIFARRIATNPMRGLALSVLILGCQAIVIAATWMQPQYLYATAIGPILMATMILAISYDRRLALALGATLILIVMVSLNLSIGFALIALTGVGIIACYLDDVRSRSRLVVIGLRTGIAMAICCLFVHAGDAGQRFEGFLHQVWNDASILLAIGIIAGILVQGILPAVEKLFRVTTSMTLRELNDASCPLLRQMAEEAPGTYQHSLRIADMSEAAAEAIGAYGLLCRVGAMYHDIGKINKPLYFVENQQGGPNRHAKLSPAMSLLIIVGHVKDGMEMAREFSLPKAIRGFIQTHHGTTLVEYFYHAARQQKEAEKEPAPKDFEFRYPGPKPQTREQAILMLSDALESASRTLSEPTPVRLEQLVHNIAIKRLMDGQFDECNLTLMELHRIEQALTKTLCAIYHARIAYPPSSDTQTPSQRQAPTSAVS